MASVKYLTWQSWLYRFICDTLYRYNYNYVSKINNDGSLNITDYFMRTASGDITLKTGDSRDQFIIIFKHYFITSSYWVNICHNN